MFSLLVQLFIQDQKVQDLTELEEIFFGREKIMSFGIEKEVALIC
jgi:mannitol/fructose-specific phosphotransferase system IIA component (Ntr-type)